MKTKSFETKLLRRVTRSRQMGW